jgi:hypothetical protein
MLANLACSDTQRKLDSSCPFCPCCPQMAARKVLVVVAAAACLAGASAHKAAPVRELDYESFQAIVRQEDVDTLVMFLEDNHPQDVAAAAALDTAAARLTAASPAGTAPAGVLLASYSISLHPVPSGVHFHHTPFIVLFPAGGREPITYEWQEDPLSLQNSNGGAGEAAAASAGSSNGRSHSSSWSTGDNAHSSAAASVSDSDGAHHQASVTCDGGQKVGGGRRASDNANGASASCSANDDHSHHDHSSSARVSAAGVLQFLRRHSTFAAEVPAATLAERWAGRDMFAAVAEGVETIRQQQAQLRLRVKELEATVLGLEVDNARLRAACPVK